MPQISLVLHNIRSTHNVGSIFRTAEGFGVTNIILSGYTPYPQMSHDTRLPHISEKIAKQIHKTALGAETMLPFEYYQTLDEWLRTTTLPLIALEQNPASTALPNFIPPKEFALLLGEEVHGINDDYLSRCDTIVEIPMRGQKESFNVSVAAAIALYELSRS